MNGTMNLEPTSAKRSTNQDSPEFRFLSGLLESVVDELATEQGSLTRVSLVDVKHRFTQALQKAHRHHGSE